MRTLWIKVLRMETHMPPHEVCFEGFRDQDILNLPSAKFEQLILLGEPIVFRIGTATLLGSFKVDCEDS